VEFYPLEARLAHEQGVCTVKMTVFADGHIDGVSVIRSTGYPDLDQACVEAFAGGHLQEQRRGITA
jgi:TonB family protein